MNFLLCNILDVLKDAESVNTHHFTATSNQIHQLFYWSVLHRKKDQVMLIQEYKVALVSGYNFTFPNSGERNTEDTFQTLLNVPIPSLQHLPWLCGTINF